jgi:hypothetical protein
MDECCVWRLKLEGKKEREKSTLGIDEEKRGKNVHARARTGTSEVRLGQDFQDKGKVETNQAQE